MAVVECFYLPSALLFSSILLGEQLSPGGIMGSCLVLSAILVETFQGGRGLYDPLFLKQASLIFNPLRCIFPKSIVF